LHDAKPSVDLDLDLAGIQMTLGAAGRCFTHGARQPEMMASQSLVAQADGLNLHQLRVLIYEDLGKKANGKETAEVSNDAKAGKRSGCPATSRTRSIA